MINRDTVQLSVSAVKEKCRNKREIYNFLAVDVGAYLPPYHDVSTFYLRVVLAGKKKFVPNDAVKLAVLPQYEGLHLKDLMQGVAGVGEVLEYFPEAGDWFHQDRQWTVKMVNTLCHASFQEYVKERVHERKRKVEAAQHVHVELTPAIAAKLRESDLISTTSGKAVDLLRNTAKRRARPARIVVGHGRASPAAAGGDTMHDDEEVKQNPHDQERDAELRRLREQAAEYEALVQALLAQGLVDARGNILSK